MRKRFLLSNIGVTVPGIFFLSYGYLSSKQITHFELPYVLGNLAGLFVTGILTLSSILPFTGDFRLRLLVQVR